MGIYFIKEVGSIDLDVLIKCSLIFKSNYKKPSKFEKRIREMSKIWPIKLKLKIIVKKSNIILAKK